MLFLYEFFNHKKISLDIFPGNGEHCESYNGNSEIPQEAEAVIRSPEMRLFDLASAPLNTRSNLLWQQLVTIAGATTRDKLLGQQRSTSFRSNIYCVLGHVVQALTRVGHGLKCT